MLSVFAFQAQSACNFFDKFVDNKDGTVTDPRDGLIWKRCAEGSEFNGSSCSTGGTWMKWDDATKAAKVSSFIGKSDWKLPTSKQLSAVVDIDCGGDAVRQKVYAASNMIAHPMETSNFSRGNFWTSSVNPGGVTVVSFYYGYRRDHEASDGAFVRLVREPREDSNKQDELNRISKAKAESYFFDNRTNLMWRKCAMGRYWDNEQRMCLGDEVSAPWLDMAEIVSKDTFASFNDWRLPTEAELRGLIEDRKYERCSQLVGRVRSLFPDGSLNEQLWLLDNSSDMQSPTTAYLNFDHSYCGYINKSYRSHAKFTALLVRGGTIPDAWKIALSKTSQSQAVVDQSKKAGAAYWNGVDSKINDFFSSGANASSGASSNSGSNSKVDWTITSEENGGGLAHWYTKKYNAKCTSGRKSGQLITIHLLKSSGKYQEVSGSVKNSLAEAARDACS